MITDISTVITLILTEDEARWLQGYLQIRVDFPDETKEDKDMRVRFFDALTGAL